MTNEKPKSFPRNVVFLSKMLRFSLYKKEDRKKVREKKKKKKERKKERQRQKERKKERKPAVPRPAVPSLNPNYDSRPVIV